MNIKKWNIKQKFNPRKKLFYTFKYHPYFAGRTAEELKAFLCQSDWWDHSFTIREL